MSNGSRDRPSNEDFNVFTDRVANRSSMRFSHSNLGLSSPFVSQFRLWIRLQVKGTLIQSAVIRDPRLMMKTQVLHDACGVSVLIGVFQNGQHKSQDFCKFTAEEQSQWQ